MAIRLPLVFRFLIAALAACLFADAAVAADAIRLLPGVPVVVAADEPGPVVRAAADLQRDLQGVLGESSPRLERAPADPDAPAIVIARNPAIGGTESHAITVRGKRILLEGADTRGTIYAIYSFSDRCLDVPPWWFWAGWKPRPRPVVEVPTGTSLHWPSPQVRWRAWFPNDMDLLTPWLRKDYDARWNLMIETMLRLKLNMIDIGEVFDDSVRKVRIPRDRGLAITTTHIAPFGALLKNWDKYWTAQGKTPPPLRLDNVRGMEEFWEHHIRLIQREKLEMLWMIGFRGDGDKGFYKTFPDAPADTAGRAAAIQKMMERQVALLNRVTGDAHPPMRTVLYDECSDYVAAGLLHPPEEPSLIWNFVAARRDHFPAADLRQFRAPADRLLGYYFNIQFTSTGSHLADGEGPWKMEQTHRAVLAAGGRFVFSVVNSGNTREFPLSFHAHARMMWDPSDYATDRFVDEFCRRYWGEHGPQVAALYRDYYDAYWQQRRADLLDFPRQYIFHDFRISQAIREILRSDRPGQGPDDLLGDRGMGYYRIVPGDCGAATKLDAVIAGGRGSAERFARVADRCAELAPRLNPQGRPFFDQSLRAQAAFLAAASRCLVATAEAYKARQDKMAYQQRVREAQAADDAMETALKSTAVGPFADWYAEEKLFKFKETRDMLRRRAQLR